MRLIVGMIFLFVFAQMPLHAQDHYKRKFHEFYDDKPVHFGFLFGFASSNYTPNGGSETIISPRNFGFQIGGIVNYAYNKHLELKSGLNIALYDRSLVFAPSFNEPLIRESTWLEIPLLVKYKSVRRDNHRMYLIGGVKVGLEANVRRRETALSAKTADLSLEYGFGLERFFQHFKFTPEIRFSHGITNLFFPPSSTGTGNVLTYSQLNNLKTHTVTLIFNFE